MLTPARPRNVETNSYHPLKLEVEEEVGADAEAEGADGGAVYLSYPYCIHEVVEAAPHALYVV